ncbi:EamA family transporter [Nonomuraea sp. NPDC049152]|uniref:EamA family transporter n=1 Tax=Nonomuraea sp. NPDC049152 TaxID=3154350 RepID=UPI0033E67625
MTATTATVAPAAYVNPLVAVCLGWLILAEPVRVPTLVGGVITVLAVAVVVRSEFQR